MQEILPFGLQLIDLITGLAGIAALLAVFAVWNAALVRDPMRNRVKALQERREALKAGFIAPQRRKSPVKRLDSVSWMRRIVNKLRLLQSEQTKKTQQKLTQAGWRGKDAIVVFLFFKLLLPLLVTIIVIVWVYGFKVFAGKPLVEISVATGSVLFSFFLPDLYLKNTVDKRTDAIRKALPDALDLMVICAEAGLTLDAALKRVSSEMGNAAPELADEFGLASIELGFLTERKQALQNLADRVNLAALRAVVTTLIQTERYGTPLAASLRVLAAEFRNERMMKAEEKAARLPAIMTVPLILFILPVLFIVLLGPATCRVADEFVGRMGK
ncbi:MAG: type II secretion system F family protein [Sphingomonadales bacterium]|nr:type II secretion system F family protein [Sphingomonadales bacterium]